MGIFSRIVFSVRLIFGRTRLMSDQELESKLAGLSSALAERCEAGLAKLAEREAELVEAKLDYGRRAIEFARATEALEREKFALREYVNLGAVHCKTHVEMWRARN